MFCRWPRSGPDVSEISIYSRPKSIIYVIRVLIFDLLILRVPIFYLLVDDSRPKFLFTDRCFASQISIYWPMVRVPNFYLLPMIRVPHFYLLVDDLRPNFYLLIADSRPNLCLLTDGSRPKFIFTDDVSRPQFLFTG